MREFDEALETSMNPQDNEPNNAETDSSQLAVESEQPVTPKQTRKITIPRSNDSVEIPSKQELSPREQRLKARQDKNQSEQTGRPSEPINSERNLIQDVRIRLSRMEVPSKRRRRESDDYRPGM